MQCKLIKCPEANGFDAPRVNQILGEHDEGPIEAHIEEPISRNVTGLRSAALFCNGLHSIMGATLKEAGNVHELDSTSV